MNNVDEKPRIQDFIVEIKNSSEQKAAVNYEIVLENSCDFIISRKTAKTERILAIIVSQNLYYIKDKNSSEIIKLDYESGKAFFKDLRDNYIKLNEVKWLNGINKDSYQKILEIISDTTYVEMCKHNLFFLCRNMQDYRNFVQSDMKFFEYIFNNLPNKENTYKYDLDFFEFAYLVKKEFGVNEARFFVEKYCISSMSKFDIDMESYRYGNEKNNVLYSIIKAPEYNIEFRRFIEYVLFDIYAQGKNRLDYQFWRNYKDYLDMQIEVYGFVREKYPKHFETEHDIITLKHSLKEFEVEEEKFNNAMNKYENLGYSDKKYLIRVPQKAEELTEEGEKLNHCVGSYGPRIISGDCGVVFLRQREFANEPFITVEIVNNKVRQVQGINRRKPNHEEMEFLRKWAYEKSLRIAV